MSFKAIFTSRRKNEMSASERERQKKNIQNNIVRTSIKVSKAKRHELTIARAEIESELIKLEIAII